MVAQSVKEAAAKILTVLQAQAVNPDDLDDIFKLVKYSY